MPMPNLAELDAEYQKEDKKVWKSAPFKELKALLNEKGGHRAVMLLDVLSHHLNPQSVVFSRPVLGNEKDMVWRGAEKPVVNRIQGLTDYICGRSANTDFDLHLPYFWKPDGEDYPEYDDSMQLNIHTGHRDMKLTMDTYDHYDYQYQGHGGLVLIENCDPAKEKANERTNEYFLALREEIYGREVREIARERGGVGGELLVDVMFRHVPRHRVDLEESPITRRVYTHDDDEGTDTIEEGTSIFPSGQLTGNIEIEGGYIINTKLTFDRRHSRNEKGIQLSLDWGDGNGLENRYKSLLITADAHGRSLPVEERDYLFKIEENSEIERSSKSDNEIFRMPAPVKTFLADFADMIDREHRERLALHQALVSA